MHRPKKSLGQNFLQDKRMRERIVAACSLADSDCVVEIGPGQGAITGLIAPRVGHLVCVEKDPDLLPILKGQFTDDHLRIIEGDFLDFDLSSLKGPVKVVGNIPYNISTPILERLVLFRHSITQAYLTVQLEFAQRVSAKPGGKSIGALSYFVQYYASATIAFPISKGCFSPVPKVDSALLILDFTKPFSPQAKDEPALFKLIQTCFTNRRKTLVNAASILYPKPLLEEALTKLNLPKTIRPEELSLEKFVLFSDALKHLNA